CGEPPRRSQGAPEPGPLRRQLTREIGLLVWTFRSAAGRPEIAVWKMRRRRPVRNASHNHRRRDGRYNVSLLGANATEMMWRTYGSNSRSREGTQNGRRYPKYCSPAI